MKISIIVPIYNVENYLKRCIDSIINQTHENLEIILVNDGSTDSCGYICDGYSKLDSRIIVIHQKNKGLPAARNSGLKIATGSYVSFIDSDDRVESNMIEEFITKVISNNFPDIITSNIFQYNFGNTKYTHVRNKSFIYNRVLNKSEIKENYIKPYYGGVLGNIPSVCTKLYKMSFIISNKIYFDESLVRAADYWYNLEAFKKAKTLFSINKAYYYYYVIPTSNIRKYRKNDFNFFLKTRDRLLKENKYFNIDVNWEGLNAFFINNTNEFIILIIKNERIITGYKKIKTILINKEFTYIINNTDMNKTHTKLIKFFINNQMYFFAFCVYYLWAIKSN